MQDTDMNEQQNFATVTLELQISLSTLDKNRVTKDVLTLDGKLTKADAGRLAIPTEKCFSIRLEADINENGELSKPKVETRCHSKEAGCEITHKKITA